MALYALNLLDLAENDRSRRYSRRFVAAVGKHAGRVVVLGRFAGALGTASGVRPRTVMVLVEGPSRELFDALLENPEHEDLRPLRQVGTRNYLRWGYERLEYLRPLFRETTSNAGRGD